MNGQPLPHFNGFPARAHRARLDRDVLDEARDLDPRRSTKPFDGFWMKSAYRIPLGKFPLVARFPSQETDANTPITEMMVNSLITGPSKAAKLKANATAKVSRHRLGWRLWHPRWSRSRPTAARPGPTATLGEDLGRFAFRSFTSEFTPKSGKHVVMARATNKIGQGQTDRAHPESRRLSPQPCARRDGRRELKGAMPCERSPLPPPPSLLALPAFAGEERSR